MSERYMQEVPRNIIVYKKMRQTYIAPAIDKGLQKFIKYVGLMYIKLIMSPYLLSWKELLLLRDQLAVLYRLLKVRAGSMRHYKTRKY